MDKAVRARHAPIRSCVACRQTSDKRTLLRVVRKPEKDGGGVETDLSGRKPGRGAYVCRDIKCIQLAAKQRRFDRALSVTAGTVPQSLFDELTAQCVDHNAQT